MFFNNSLLLCQELDDVFIVYHCVKCWTMFLSIFYYYACGELYNVFVFSVYNEEL